MMALLATLIAMIAMIPGAKAINWAQCTGNRTQNNVIPYYNGWTARWGHGLVADEDAGRIYLLGGDDYRGWEDGGGKLHNDVWRTTGASWSRFKKIVTSEVRMASQLSWRRVWPDKLPPTGTGYYEWLECFSRPWQGAAECTSTEDPFDGDLRRWSPRRNHATTYWKRSSGDSDVIWVIGGLAADETGSRADHAVQLRNDVWASSNGAAWTLVNPGCRFEDVQANPGLGAEHSTCRSDVDCYGESQCVDVLTGLPLTALSMNGGRCSCTMFRPRERHAVAVFNNRLYLSGGITHVRATDCGDFPCNEGGYATVADDIWYTDDGISWQQLTGISHAYADHGLIPRNGALWLVTMGQDAVNALTTPSSAQDRSLAVHELGGKYLAGLQWPRTVEQRDVGPDFDEDFVFIASANEVYKYTLGSGWARVSNDTNNVAGTVHVWADAPVWRVQGDMTAADAAALEDAGISTLRELAAVGPQTVVSLRSDRDVFYICRYKYRAIAILNKCALKPNYGDGYWNSTHRAEILAPMTHPYLRSTWTTSSDTSTTTEDEDAEEAHFIYGSDGCEQAELDEEKIAHLDEMSTYRSNAAAGIISLSCRWGFPDRTQIGAVNFGGKLYVAGGKIVNRPKDLVFEERGDTWYRDDTVPLTLMSTKPEDSTSDTEFEFSCDENDCLFEYKVEVMADDDSSVVEMLQDWIMSTGATFDLLELFPGGGRYRMTVRAIDPAGNVDVVYAEGRNQYTWTYVPKVPVGLIMGILFIFALLGLAVYLEMRRRKKKAALERYALKRMRRKFKGMQKRNQNEKNKKKKGKKGKKGKKKGGGKDKGGTSSGKKKKKKSGDTVGANDKKKKKKKKNQVGIPASADDGPRKRKKKKKNV
ncbi:Hypothetical Protein FCC1311_094732 [Hondaea fermentalgiana]|uniref:Uncharacterized protein n=1 Tax=Hondaea fermentalgiana TaxID=2315210 RepID=A0A2R5GSG2_9STRA|nr:Hypothetical Protein FCC1311_094732 [Hondaea fermentalgiana]|eukprot:GBG33249.1 Hypothetical Protein FCC1311_094732 [Hondaea fermentalgiana]